MNLILLWENLLFLVLATAFFGLVGLAWRTANPFSIPETPTWFKGWLTLILWLGLLLPLLALLLWGIWWQYWLVLDILLSYFMMLGLQILFEIIAVKHFQSCVWVMIPCLYLPYRIWQLYQGLVLINSEANLIWIKALLILEIILWIFNYGVHISQLPRLFRWQS